MIFCLGEGKYEKKGIGYQKNNMVFNKPVDDFDKAKKQYDQIGIEIPLTEYVLYSKMTDEQKNKYSEAQTTGGILVVREYKEAWSLWWKDNSHKAEQIKALPNFDSEIFEKITGIKIDESKTILEKDGKRYEVQILREIE